MPIDDLHGLFLTQLEAFMVKFKNSLKDSSKYQKISDSFLQEAKSSRDSERSRRLFDFAINVAHKPLNIYLSKCQFLLRQKNYFEAAKTAQETVENCPNVNGKNATLLAQYFVTAKLKTDGKKDMDDWQKWVLTKSVVTVMREELKIYRSYSSFCDLRQELAVEISKSKNKNAVDKCMVNVELASILLAKKIPEALKCLNNAKKEIIAANSDSVDKKSKKQCEGFIEFWTGICKWFQVKKSLNKARKLAKDQMEKKASDEQQQNNKDGNDESVEKTREVVMEISDGVKPYCKVLSLDQHNMIMSHFKTSYKLLSESEEPSSGDGSLPKDWIEAKEVLKVLREILILNGILERSVATTSTELRSVDKVSSASDLQPLLRFLRFLIKRGHHDKVLEMATKAAGSALLEKSTVENRLAMSELKLLIGIVLFTLSKTMPAEGGPLDFAYQAVKLSASVCAKFDNNNENKEQEVGLHQLCVQFRAYGVAMEARKFYLDVLKAVGMGKEMRMVAKLILELGQDMAFVPSLCQNILDYVEIDLICDDEKEAEVKLKEVEGLLGDVLKSDVDQKRHKKKATTSKSENPKLVLPKKENEELMCASPALAKKLYSLPDWIAVGDHDQVVLKSLVVKYFLYQGVAWHFQNDNEAMKYNFDLVENLCESNNELKWIVECYARLEDYDKCQEILNKMKSCSIVTDELYVSIHAAKSFKDSSKKEFAQPSPLPDNHRLPTDQLKTPAPPKPEGNGRRRGPPPRRPKKALPVSSDVDIHKLVADLKLDEINSTDEDKSPEKDATENKDLVNKTAFKTPNVKAVTKEKPVAKSTVKKAPKKTLEVYQDSQPQQSQSEKKPTRTSARRLR